MPMLRGLLGSRESRFVWGGLLVVAVVGLVLASNRAGDVLAEKEANAQQRAEHFADTVLFDFLTPVYVDEAAVGSRYRDLIIQVQGGIMTDERVARVRIWDPDGQLLFSTDERDKVGQAFQAQLANVEKAVGGQTVSVVLLDRIAAKAGLAAQQEELLETFVPLRIRGRIPVQGAVQIDQRYDAIQQVVDRDVNPRRNAFALAFAVFGIMFVLSFFVPAAEPRSTGRHAARAREDDPGSGTQPETAGGRDAQKAEERARKAEEELQRAKAEVRELSERAKAAEAAAAAAGQAESAGPDPALLAQATARASELEEELRETKERLDSAGMHRDGLIEQVRQVQQERDEARLETEQAKAAAARLAAGAEGSQSAVVEAEERATQAEERATQAEERATQAEERATQAEGQLEAAQGQLRATHEQLGAAEDRLSQLESAAVAEDTLTSVEAAQAVERADQAEARLEESRSRLRGAEARIAELESAATEATEGTAAEAGERVAALEERVHALGQRAAAADDQLRAAESRATDSDEQLRAAEERALAAERQLESLETRAAEADERTAADSDEQLRAAEERALAAERQLESLEARAVGAEERAAAAESRAAEADERTAAAESRATDAEGRATTAETRVAQEDAQASAAERQVRELEEQLQAADQRAANAEADAAAAKQRFGELEQRVGQIEGQAAEAARQLQEAERRLSAARREAPGAPVDVAPLPEEQASALRARLASASAQRMAKQPGVHHDVPATPPAPPMNAEEEAVHAAVLNEIRGPLSSILGLSLTMKSAVESDEGKTMVRQLAASSKRLERLLADLQDVDAITRGTLELKRRKTDLEAMVTRIVGETPELSDRIVQLHADTAKASVDSARAEQIVEALLFNALERTRSGMPVWVRVEPREGGALVAVDDEALEDPGKAASRLTVADRLAQLHGGRLWAEPRGAGGTSFRVWLPEAPGQAPVEPAEGAVDENAGASDGE